VAKKKCGGFVSTSKPKEENKKQHSLYKKDQEGKNLGPPEKKIEGLGGEHCSGKNFLGISWENGTKRPSKRRTSACRTD